VNLDLSDVFFRLLAAAVAGGLVGLNRDLADKPIGVRTLGLVSLGAATVSVAGIQVQGMAEHADAMSRVVQGIIQGVMAGISFVGAGVILRNSTTRTVEGLTTAATVWMSAAFGVACGLGAWRTIAIAVPIAMAMLFSAGWIDALKRQFGTNDGEKRERSQNRD
jgi:putative Mg2+ transporter-C (MgtC) family protein